jgi:hypothetical protein
LFKQAQEKQEYGRGAAGDADFHALENGIGTLPALISFR